MSNSPALNQDMCCTPLTEAEMASKSGIVKYDRKHPVNLQTVFLNYGKASRIIYLVDLYAIIICQSEPGKTLAITFLKTFHHWHRALQNTKC
jgi:hypothetical protein